MERTELAHTQGRFDARVDDALTHCEELDAKAAQHASAETIFQGDLAVVKRYFLSAQSTPNYIAAEVTYNDGSEATETYIVDSQFGMIRVVGDSLRGSIDRVEGVTPEEDRQFHTRLEHILDTDGDGTVDECFATVQDVLSKESTHYRIKDLGAYCSNVYQSVIRAAAEVAK